MHCGVKRNGVQGMCYRDEYECIIAAGAGGCSANWFNNYDDDDDDDDDP